MRAPIPTAPASSGRPDDRALDDRPTRSSRIRLVVVLLCAAGTSAIALTDAVVHGVTGHSVLPAEETEPAVVVASIIHGITYAALCWVLVTEAYRIDSGARLRTWLRRGLIADLLVMSALFLVGIPLSAWISALRTNPTVDDVFSVVGNGAFLGMFALAFALGVSTIRRAALRPAPYLLIGIVPAIGLMIGLGALGSDFAHPAYAETLVNFGIALFGRRRHQH